MIAIRKADLGIKREPLSAPFGFKGGYLSEIWQTAVRLESESGGSGVGVGVQSVLWSDPNVFVAHPEAEGNEMMADLTRFALQEAAKEPFATPFELLDRLLPDVYAYGKRRTGNDRLRLTFVLNALVPVDWAAWQLYAREHQFRSFDAMLPEEFRPALAERHRELAAVPLIAYGTDEAEIVRMLDEGSYVLKIKLGSDPDKDGDLDKMLEWDKERLSQIHRIAGERETSYTANGRIAYYLDANGRYDGRDRVQRLLDHADRIGALDRILVFEEPFAEDNKTDLNGLPVTFAADESVHSLEDAAERIELGYGAFALKPIAKTMSMSLRVAKLAHERGIPCFCADLTVNPFMVDWNKNVAARLAPLPGIKTGLIETNGAQNYADWATMKTYHPAYGAPWTDMQGGMFILDDGFWERSGAVLETSAYYEQLATSGATGGQN